MRINNPEKSACESCHDFEWIEMCFKCLLNKKAFVGSPVPSKTENVQPKRHKTSWVRKISNCAAHFANYLSLCACNMCVAKYLKLTSCVFIVYDERTILFSLFCSHFTFATHSHDERSGVEKLKENRTGVRWTHWSICHVKMETLAICFERATLFSV